MHDVKSNIKEYLKQGKDNYMEHYRAHMLERLNEQSKQEKMAFLKTRASAKVDVKTNLLRDYLDPVKGKQYKDIDLARIELEKTVQHMPVSMERMAVECKLDIARCKNFAELKQQLESDKPEGSRPAQEGEGTFSSRPHNGHLARSFRRRGPRNHGASSSPDGRGPMSPGRESTQGPGEDRTAIEDLLRASLQTGTESREVRKLIESLEPSEYRAIVAKLEREKHSNHPLRLRYNPQQMNFKRALKAAAVAEEAGLVNEQARDAA